MKADSLKNTYELAVVVAADDGALLRLGIGGATFVRVLAAYGG